MLIQIFTGVIASVLTISIHAFLMNSVFWAARNAVAITIYNQSLKLTAVMIATVSFLMAAHLAEVFVWAVVYSVVGIAPKGTNLVYFSFVNYTTLGYGDVTPSQRWQLLGPMTAMNGILLFGWSTAVIFEILRRALATIRSEETKGDSEKA